MFSPPFSKGYDFMKENQFTLTNDSSVFEILCVTKYYVSENGRELTLMKVHSENYVQEHMYMYNPLYTYTYVVTYTYVYV